MGRNPRTLGCSQSWRKQQDVKGGNDGREGRRGCEGEGENRGTNRQGSKKKEKVREEENEGENGHFISTVFMTEGCVVDPHQHEEFD